MFGFKSVQQKRIDADARVIAGLRSELEKERERAERIAGRLSVANNLCSDAAVRLAELRAERDSYKPDALKFRASRANLKQYQPKPNGTAAAVQGVSSHVR